MPILTEKPIPSGAKTLVDTYIFECQEITEAVDGRPFKVRGIFQKADVKNGNGRIYPRSLWERIVSDPTIQEKIKTRGMVGEVEHPQDGQTDLKRVSHVVTTLGMDNEGNIIGEAEIFDTEPHGKNLKELLRK